MTIAAEPDWRAEFGIEERRSPSFFSSKADLDSSVPQAHMVRRAFDLLELDGVLCSDHSPLIYFKKVGRFDAATVARLHRKFWNHGGAPILVLISRDQVQIYSGMSRPVVPSANDAALPSLVETLDRVSETLQTFLASVESGEFFRQQSRSFDPKQRVDRDLLDNLKDTREKLDEINDAALPPQVLDALLCRLVFTCYLFDRGVIGKSYLRSIGMDAAAHLSDVLGIRPLRQAKTELYRLFARLGKDFNGDLFSDDLEAEAASIQDGHVAILNDFFRGTVVRSGQGRFWRYDFGVIPIESISAIYERFLKAADEEAGAFYTPRFLAEIVLDTALEGMPTLLRQRYLDPACGSGIFLVGLFVRMAEEWKQANPSARNDRKVKELMRLMRESLFGVDVNPTACRITAFSLYLAYLDQLAPRDIQELQEKGAALPRLVVDPKRRDSAPGDGNIWCGDFFAEGGPYPRDVALVVGNPPWSSKADKDTPAGKWCSANGKPLPDKQMAAAFVWKAVEHVSSSGRICLVLPHGVLFHFSPTCKAYQRAWTSQHTLERVLNLADLRWFLFEKAVHPAIVVTYRPARPEDKRHPIDYWAPKTDWAMTQAEVINVTPGDRSTVHLDDLLCDLAGPDAPQTWKQRFWATPRDLRLLDRLMLYPRLRDHVRNPKQKSSTKPWLMAVGFQPLGVNDDPDKAETIRLPSRLFIPATSDRLDLFLLASDCTQLSDAAATVRSGSNKDTEVFRSPHVLLSKGFTNACYADFDVSFQDALRGIRGPAEHRDLMVFLAAYLRTPLAKYFLFHTSSDWGMARPQVHVEEVLRLPMPLPDQQPDRRRSWQIVKEIVSRVDSAAHRAGGDFVDRTGIVLEVSQAIEPLVYEYFDVLPLEKLLIDDWFDIIRPSIQPRRNRLPVPTVAPSSPGQRDAYRDRVCDMLNGWAKKGGYRVSGSTHASDSLGIGMVVLKKSNGPSPAKPQPEDDGDVLKALDRLRKVVAGSPGAIDPARGLMVFDRDQLYVVKPISQRHWTQTAALNDADEIAGTLLMHMQREG